MRRYLILLSLGVLCSTFSLAQVKKHFSVEKDKDFERINFSFELPSGTCYISPKQVSNPLNIYSNQDIENYNYKFDKWVRNKTYYIHLNLNEKESDSYGKSISYNLFSKSSNADNQIWKVYLSDETPYSLDLKYGIGDAYVDLSGLAVDKLTIHTGSANVNVGFLDGMENQVEMDTFKVKVDLGTLTARRMDLKLV